MASHSIHEKWCQALGVKKEICKEVNRIIDILPPHDIVDKLLKWKWLREAFERRKITRPINMRNDYEKVTTKLAEITNRFGEDGIKATFSHIALDRIYELIELGYNKKEIKNKLIKDDLMKYIPDYEQVFKDISMEVKPNIYKIKRKEEFEEIVRKGIRGMFIIDNNILPPAAALLKIKKQIKKGKARIY